MRAPPRMLVIFTFAVFLVVGAVVALATESWWVLLVAIAIHGIATAVVLLVTRGALAQTDKPDPLTEAREESGAGGDEADERGDDEPRMAI